MKSLLKSLMTSLRSAWNGLGSMDYHWRSYYGEDVGGMTSASNWCSHSPSQIAGKPETSEMEVVQNISRKEM